MKGSKKMRKLKRILSLTGPLKPNQVIKSSTIITIVDDYMRIKYGSAHSRIINVVYREYFGTPFFVATDSNYNEYNIVPYYTAPFKPYFK
jgi:hypothetical protein